jgi:heme-degrading monooxygenase HmoA
MYVILWRLRPHPSRESEFLAAYGAGGSWERLFRSASGFLGTELLRGSDGAYLTIDRWESEDAHRAFREAAGRDYEALDADCAAFTLEESLLTAVTA